MADDVLSAVRAGGDMRWVVGWNGADEALVPPGLRPVAGRALWGGPHPLWLVGDWRPDEIRTATLHRRRPRRPSADADSVRSGLPPWEPEEDDRATARLAVLGRCGAADSELRTALLAASGGALRHLTLWPGSYTVVLQQGSRTSVLGDLAGLQQVFHTPWAGGTAYATAALPLADLVGAPADPLYLAARLAVPESPEGAGEFGPFAGVRRVPPAHALTLRAGVPDITGYEPPVPQTASVPTDAAATAEVTRALLAALRLRVRAASDAETPVPEPVESAGATTHGFGWADALLGPVPETAPAVRPPVSVDLSGGSASTTLALLAARIPVSVPVPAPAAEPRPVAAVPARHPARGGFPEERWGDPRSSRTLRLGPPDGAAPARRSGAVRGSWARVPAARPQTALGLLAVTWTDGATAVEAPLPPDREAELVRARELAEGHPRLDHLLLPGGPETLPYAELTGDPLAGPLTDEPAPALVTSLRDRARLAEAGTDHLTGHGARQALDGHPARLADLLTARQRGSLVRPVAALARTEGTPVTLLRAARQLAKGTYAEGLEDAATRLVAGPSPAPTDALAWCAPGPAASWLTQEARAAVAVRLRVAARRPAPEERPGARRARLALERRASELRVLAQVVESAESAHGQRLHAPFLDNQVVRACRQVPDAARTQPGGRRAILRAVLAGAGVPEGPAETGASAPPGPGPSAAAGLAAARHGLDGLFAAPVLAELGLLDADRFRAALAAFPTLGAAAQDAVAQVVATELWLRRLRSRRGTSWQGLPPAPLLAVAPH